MAAAFKIARSARLVAIGCLRTNSRLPVAMQQKYCDHGRSRSEEHTSELQSPYDLVCRLLLEKKKKPYRLPLVNHPDRGSNHHLAFLRDPSLQPLHLAHQV